jgi:hypothetical protein
MQLYRATLLAVLATAAFPTAAFPAPDFPAADLKNDPGSAPERKVTFCFDYLPNPWLVNAAGRMASKIYAPIGVESDWRYMPRGCPRDGIQIHLRDDTPDTFHPGSLAYSLPFEGVHIEIFYDRILRTVEQRLAPYLLAHVLVHESAHMLEGVADHSETGMMRAKWDAFDLSQMAKAPLQFTPRDVLLIHLGMDKRAERLTASRQ